MGQRDFRKAMVQGMMSNQTDSKQDKPLVLYRSTAQKDFDGYLGDLRRFCNVTWREDKPIQFAGLDGGF